MNQKKIVVLLLGLMLMMFAAGCKKKAPPPPPPPPPPPAPVKVAPKPPQIVMFSAEPGSIERGQSSTLKWTITGADSARIEPGIGSVSNTGGNRTVFPSSTTQYTLTVTGPGGTATANATVNVTAPPPPPPKPAPVSKTFLERMAELQPAYFDYDRSNIRDDARSVLTRNADLLKAIFRDFPNQTVVIEGHCDERGSAEYNLGLGDRRSTAAREFLVQLGVPGDRLRTISYGKERPVCMESNESCWQRNRRAAFTGQ
ncbi:MAG: OmpA family protein [Bryobacterales bacterium]|jgi:peptidoglycan-associated lipoprotein|nr:OmpA family protein [Bryobacterales bacterium]